MSFADLPAELLLEILTLALYNHPTPSSIVRLNSRFRSISLQILHADLSFRSSDKIKLFRRTSLTCAPRSITVDLGEGDTDHYFFQWLLCVFLRCINDSQSHGWPNVDYQRRITLDLLSLRLNFNSTDPIRLALTFVNPRRLIWTALNPPHHFSYATFELFSALRAYTNLTHLKLTNVAFPEPRTAIIPDIPSLRSIYIRQATFLSPSSIAALVTSQRTSDTGTHTQLQEIQLVDAYQQSIWGPRLRRSDIEAAANFVDGREETIERIQRVVRCEARTENMGGDRVDALELN